MLSKLMEIHVMFILFRRFPDNAAGGWFAAGKVLRLFADVDAGIMKVAVVETDGTCTGMRIGKCISHSAKCARWRRFANRLLVWPSS
jgi:hypothetical protein